MCRPSLRSSHPTRPIRLHVNTERGLSIADCLLGYVRGKALELPFLSANRDLPMYMHAGELSIL